MLRHTLLVAAALALAWEAQASEDDTFTVEDEGGAAPAGAEAEQPVDAPPAPPDDFDYEEMMRKMQQENPEMFANMGGMRGMMGGYPGAGMMGGGMGGRGKKPKKEKPPPAWRKGLSDGQLIDFEEAAKKFSTGRLMKNTLKDTRAMLDNAEYYVKTMERIQERGSKYPRTERERIKGILKKGGLKKDKQAQMEARVNILTTFIRAILNDKDTWKRYDAEKLEQSSPTASANPPPSPPRVEDTAPADEEVTLEDEDDRDL